MPRPGSSPALGDVLGLADERGLCRLLVLLQPPRDGLLAEPLAHVHVPERPSQRRVHGHKVGSKRTESSEMGLPGRVYTGRQGLRGVVELRDSGLGSRRLGDWDVARTRKE